MSGGEHLSDVHDDDAVWVTAFLRDLCHTDSDERIMEYVVGQIKAGEVITGICSLSRSGSGYISIGLPTARVSRYVPGLLQHAEVLANWWLEQIREGIIQLDREHIFDSRSSA
jgi:hypothetical protein